MNNECGAEFKIRVDRDEDGTVRWMCGVYLRDRVPSIGG